MKAFTNRFTRDSRGSAYFIIQRTSRKFRGGQRYATGHPSSNGQPAGHFASTSAQPSLNERAAQQIFQVKKTPLPGRAQTELVMLIFGQPIAVIQGVAASFSWA